MDPHLLRTFVAVARLGSFSAAAEELGYTQSAVSQHIAALEADLKAPLLRRRPVAPTPAGARLLEHAQPLLLRLAAARADVARVNAAPHARLTVGVGPLAPLPALAVALAEVRRSHPGAEAAVRMLTAAAVVEGVATGDLDLGLVGGVAAPTDPLPLPDVGPLTVHGVGEEPVAVVLPFSHPLVAARRGLRLADLADARWLDAPEAAVPLARLRAAAGVEGFRPAVRYAGADPAGVLALAAAGHGLALLPLPLAEGAPGLAAVPVAAPRLVHRVELLLGGAPTDPAAALAERLELPA
ncbi:LysR family transcriptional regulator [Streptomyces sp. 6N223]|uniref:LysR family transcriptional regulator n=1 Tax=Streptomyces sp. 6N223 TaxID=3457412 RepID=UPI003FD08094